MPNSAPLPAAPAATIWCVTLDADSLRPIEGPFRSGWSGRPQAIADLAEGFCPSPDCGSRLVVAPGGWAYCPDPRSRTAGWYCAWRLEASDAHA